MPKKQTPKQIHQQYEMPDHDFAVAVTQKYIKINDEWKFSGYVCVACDNGFKFKNSIIKHAKTCKVLNKLKEKSNANTDDNS